MNQKTYTKTGDNGETSLLNGQRTCKCCLEMEAIGEVDELNAAIGLLNAGLDKNFFQTKEQLLKIQHKLFVIGSNLAAVQTDLTNIPKLIEEDVKNLENWIDEMSEDLPELNQFILPGGSQSAAQSYLARTICRRAERCLTSLSKKYEIDSLIKQYLNRLSDYLFTLGRWVNKKSGVEEVWWER